MTIENFKKFKKQLEKNQSSKLFVFSVQSSIKISPEGVSMEEMGEVNVECPKWFENIKSRKEISKISKEN